MGFPYRLSGALNRGSLPPTFIYQQNEIFFLVMYYLAEENQFYIIPLNFPKYHIFHDP